MSLTLLHETSIQNVVIEFKLRILFLSLESLLLLSLNLLLSLLSRIVSTWKILNVGGIDSIESISFLPLNVIVISLLV